MLENVKLWSSSKDQCSFSNSSTLPRDWRLCSVSCYRILHSYLIIEWQGWPNSVCRLPARPAIANATLARTYHAEWGPHEGDFLRWRPLCLGIFHPPPLLSWLWLEENRKVLYYYLPLLCRHRILLPPLMKWMVRRRGVILTAASPDSRS